MEPIQTEAYWDASSAAYASGAEPFTALFCADAVALADVVAGERLLDVATGPGALALAAARAGARVTATDFSQVMLDRLSDRVGALPIEVRRMDGQALALADAQFDRACSVFGVPLFPDFRAGLRELARVLRPGGLAVIAVADNPWGFGPNRLLAAARAELWPDDPAAPLTEGTGVLADADRLVVELRAAGLEEIEVHERTHDFVADPQVMRSADPLIADNPVVAGLDDEGRAEAMMRASRLALTFLRNGVIRMPCTARIAIGTRL